MIPSLHKLLLSVVLALTQSNDDVFTSVVNSVLINAYGMCNKKQLMSRRDGDVSYIVLLSFS